MHILMIDDDEEATAALSRYLARHGVFVRSSPSLVLGRQSLKDFSPEVLVLDLGLPDGDGIQFVADLRRESDLPIVIVSGRSEDVDKIMALELGADDYLVKPVNPRELLARVRAVAKRAAAGEPPPTQKTDRIEFGEFRLDSDRRRLDSVTRGQIELTAGEFDVLCLLSQNPGRPLSREFILEATRARELGVFDRSIDNLIARLRKKIGDPKYIETVRSVGYRFVDNP